MPGRNSAARQKLARRITRIIKMNFGGKSEQPKEIFIYGEKQLAYVLRHQLRDYRQFKRKNRVYPLCSRNRALFTAVLIPFSISIPQSAQFEKKFCPASLADKDAVP